MSVWAIAGPASGAPATPTEAAKAQVDREFEAMTERHRAGRF